MKLRGFAAVLTATALLPATAAWAVPGPALTVDAAAGRHAISPYIYGWNFADPALAAQIDLPVDRRGGNRADTLNWEIGVENTSSDYFFENLPWCWSSEASYCSPAPADPAAEAHHAYTDQIDADRVVGAESLIDLPMLGYVPKAPALFDHPFDCSFPKTAFMTQDAFDPFDTNCGKGENGGPGAWVTNTPQTADAVAKGPSFQGDWIDDLISRYDTAANGGVRFYELGNEPGLWNYTHHDWHPAAVDYDELWAKSQALAEVVKARDPSAQVLGFSEWGWPNYFCSSEDDLSNGCSPGDVDRAAHGGTELAAWLLQQFKAYADAHGGQRLIDYFDLHYYRQDQGAAGLAATRSLWDPTYTDQSWIGDEIHMLPRMHDWVDQNYPGTKISLSEYDMAYADDLKDNLVQADTLGIFGREGLDLATLWPETSNDHYADAFRIFRNYDGAKSKFGDTSVSSASADQSKVAIYGAERASDGALTLVVINKTAQEQTSTVSLAGFTPATNAQVWQWTGVATGIARVADQAVAASGFSATFPARSITVFAIQRPAPTLPTDGGGSEPEPSPSPPAGSESPPPVAPAPSANGQPRTRCVVPRLARLKRKAAVKRLTRAHCRLGKVTKKKSRKRVGTVIAQKPKAGRKLAAGTKVALVLSRGR